MQHLLAGYRVSQRHRGLAGGAILLALVLGGCTLNHKVARELPPLDGYRAATISELDLDQISPAMLDFLQQHVSQAPGKDRRAWNLVWATGDRNLWRFHYDPALTLSPQQTFEQASGNCLAFSGMIIAMAREIGLQAWYQEVEIPPQWSQGDGVMLVSKHVNAVIQGEQSEWVVDVSGRNASTYRRVRRISDSVALAQFYNNLGADALSADDLPLAHAYFSRAIRTQPQLSFVWSNLGVVYTRNGQDEDARWAYRTALDIDPAQNVAAHNLYLIYERDGRLEEAAALRAQVEHYRRRNPYYLYYLSSLALEQGLYQQSSEMLQQAIQLDEREFRFHYELARSLMLQGDRSAAQASLDRATAMAPQISWLTRASIDQLPPLPE